MIHIRSTAGLVPLSHAGAAEGGEVGFGIYVVRVQGSGFRVQGPGFRVQGSGFRVQGSGCMVSGLGLTARAFRGCGGRR